MPLHPAPASAGTDLAAELAGLLTAEGFGPFFGTPCGILEPFYAALERDAGLLTVPREDAAVGIAAGAAAAGRLPVVLMQNSGLGQSVNALASLTVPYRVPMLLVVSLRGVDPDPTAENLVMGRLTEPLLDGLGVPAVRIDPDRPGHQVRWAHRLVAQERRPAALLVTPSLFGWQA
ncbi:thiamine pyrophosphate-binding protein [Kitasatospora sp. NPDC089509]|uniref:thiamine pyrophosphate-binding protein n=1 Tax=Kitasatospora sp. NPDC089509 TaxID=3364079 RepID=UPI0038001AF5